jgi:hypothetical protein
MLKSLFYADECKIYFHYGVFESELLETNEGLLNDYHFITDVIDFFQSTFKDVYPTIENIIKFDGILNVYQNKIKFYGKQPRNSFYPDSMLDEFR